MEIEKKSPRNVAQAGLILGGYLVLVYLLYMFILSVPLLSLLFLIALLGIPYVQYRLMMSFKNAYSIDKPLPTTLVWAYGAQTFMFAGLVLMLPCYYYYKHMLPAQIPILEEMIQTMALQSPQMKQQLEVIYGGSPSDMLYKVLSEVSVWSYLWTTFSTSVFLGGIVSIVNALIIKYKSRGK